MTVTKVQIMGNATNGVKPIQRDVHKMVPSVTRRCLFGAPSRASLDEIWNRNLENERQRMLTKYGFDVKTEKFVSSSSAGTSFKSKDDQNKSIRSQGSYECNNVKFCSKQTDKLKSQRQTQLTDYYSSTKMKTSTIKDDNKNSFNNKNENKKSVTNK